MTVVTHLLAIVGTSRALRASLGLPWIKQRDPGLLEVRDIARDDREAMDHRRCSDQGIAFRPGDNRPFTAENGPWHSDEVTALVNGGNAGCFSFGSKVTLPFL